MAGTAGFDRDHRRCKLLEECHHLFASQLFAQNGRLSSIHSVKLKNVLRRIHPNSDNLVHGRLPLSEINTTTSFWHIDASGGRPHQQRGNSRTKPHPDILVAEVEQRVEEWVRRRETHGHWKTSCEHVC